MWVSKAVLVCGFLVSIKRLDRTRFMDALCSDVLLILVVRYILNIYIWSDRQVGEMSGVTEQNLSA